MPDPVVAAFAQPGRQIPPLFRAKAEAFFGEDLSHVRLHAGSLSTKASESVGARAFTAGSDIVFRNPGEIGDSRLLAHELAHVLQPTSAPRDLVSSPGDSAEREAASIAGRLHADSSSPSGLPVRARASRRAVIHRDARHPTATVFDSDYGLFTLSSGTDFDGDNQRYYLSPQDRSHLYRISGLYFLHWGSLHLIGPPEVRRLAGGSGVLIAAGPGDLHTVAAGGRSEAPAYVRALVEQRLGLTAPTVTLSSLADADFTRQPVPAAVANALQSPLEGVLASQRGEVEEVRRRAMSTRQDRTLSLAATRGEEPPMQRIGWSDRMDVRTLFGMDDAGRASWYARRLGSLQAQLLESALAHNLPMQLLAAVILNELADINVADVVQSGPSTWRGSLGIAQIQIDTARTDRLVDLPAGSHRTGWDNSDSHAHDVDAPAMVDMGERLRVGQLLQIPQFAIEAAAREVQQLLTRMAAHHGQPWQVAHQFIAPGPQGQAIYANVGTGSQSSREGALADAVCGAYNSPDVIAAADTSRYTNATIHGANANHLARDLFRFRLFRAT